MTLKYCIGRRNAPSASAFSRSVAYVQVHLADFDSWYKTLFRNISDNPSLFPKWRIQDGQIFKFVPLGQPVVYEYFNWKLLVLKSLSRTIYIAKPTTLLMRDIGFILKY